jgi:DNA-binding MarR family transcriptional regulator
MDSALELFHFAFRSLTAGADRVLAQNDLGRAHHRLLFFVRTRPGSSMQDLADTLKISRQALNKPFRQLVQKKLIFVGRSQHDSRIKNVFVTAKGAQLEKKLSGLQRNHLARVFGSVGREAEKGWRRSMALVALIESPEPHW